MLNRLRCPTGSPGLSALASIDLEGWSSPGQAGADLQFATRVHARRPDRCDVSRRRGSLRCLVASIDSKQRVWANRHRFVRDGCSGMAGQAATAAQSRLARALCRKCGKRRRHSQDEGQGAKCAVTCCSEMADQTQSVLNGRYALREEIARGGMAAVYLADDLRLGRQVAVKVLTPEESRQPRAVEQFRREAQAAAALSHPNVVAVYDWGCVDDTAFLVMEHVDGPDLRQLLREHGPLPEELAVRLAAQLLGALEMAHGRGIVHRDIKPRNVLIDSRGSARLADFGIAASAEDEDDAEVVYGTALYVAPELVRGQSVDGRADLYSLGVLLYEVLTGEPPSGASRPVSGARNRGAAGARERSSAAVSDGGRDARRAAGRNGQRFDGAAQARGRASEEDSNSAGHFADSKSHADGSKSISTAADRETASSSADLSADSMSHGDGSKSTSAAADRETASKSAEGSASLTLASAAGDRQANPKSDQYAWDSTSMSASAGRLPESDGYAVDSRSTQAGPDRRVGSKSDGHGLDSRSTQVGPDRLADAEPTAIPWIRRPRQCAPAARSSPSGSVRRRCRPIHMRFGLVSAFLGWRGYRRPGLVTRQASHNEASSASTPWRDAAAPTGARLRLSAAAVKSLSKRRWTDSGRKRVSCA